jgi:hypothetical protein
MRTWSHNSPFSGNLIKNNTLEASGLVLIGESGALLSIFLF